MSEARRYRVPASTLYRALHDEAILLQLDTGEYFGLDDVAHRMWQALVETGERDAAVRRLQNEFDVAPDRLAGDFDRFVDELAAEQLVEIVPADQ